MFPSSNKIILVQLIGDNLWRLNHGLEGVKSAQGMEALDYKFTISDDSLSCFRVLSKDEWVEIDQIDEQRTTTLVKWV